MEDFCMEWKWNGRKLPVWNKWKNRLPFHSIPWPPVQQQLDIGNRAGAADTAKDIFSLLVITFRITVVL